MSMPTDGTLVKAADAEAVYLIENGQRRWIPDQATFMALGFAPEAVQTVDQGTLDSFPEGEPLPTQGG